MPENIKKVYGLRTCALCSGICHESSYRTKIGARKKYYCNQSHAFIASKQPDTNFFYEIYEKVHVITD